MIDFSTQYLGLKLNGPIVVSSTPLSESIDNVAAWKTPAPRRSCSLALRGAVGAGVAALDEDLSRGTESFAESLGYLPDLKTTA
jgi:dihydroorotate dehydrogenase (fumarate)